MSRHRDPRRANLNARDCNVLDALGGVNVNADPETLEDAEAIYLRWKHRDWLAAERTAREWIYLRTFTAPLVAAAYDLHTADMLPKAEVVPAVLAFIRERWERHQFPQQKGKP